jgi:carbon-monoxide dehydrogenase large subunit
VVSIRTICIFPTRLSPVFIAQGFGRALIENCVYNAETGQILTASFTDYAMPRATDIPDIQFAYRISLRDDAIGAKGCGEAGTVGALPAVMSAVADAIGIEHHLDMPATPERVWRPLRDKQ